MIRAVLFDLDGTLRHNQPSGLDAFFEYAAEQNLAVCNEVQRAVSRWAHAYWAHSPQDVVQHSAMPDFWLTYVQGLLASAGIEDPGGAYALAIEKAFVERYRPRTVVPGESHTVLNALRAGGYTLGLVSNRNDDLAAIVERDQIGSYFHFLLTAGQAGVWKPDPRIFLQACELAGAAPHECVYIGDNLYADVLGAEAAGMLPILLDPAGVFPDASCMRIAQLGDLVTVVQSL